MNARSLVIPLLASVVLIGPSRTVTAQVRPGHVLVATRLPGGPGGAATALVEADLQSGALRPFGRFPSDWQAPLAVEIDPVNRDVILALDSGGASVFLRVRYSGVVVVSERLLGAIPARVTDIAVALAGDLFATVGGAAGGLFRIPRNGGPAVRVTALPRATAMTDFRSFTTRSLIVQSGSLGPPTIDPQISEVDLANGQVLQGPFVFQGYRPLGINGVVDIPTAVVQQLLSNEDGTIGHSLFFGPAQVVDIRPVLPPGATVAIRCHAFSFAPIVLGGAVHPFLKTFDFFSQQPPFTWQNLAGPLPGDPVDFTVADGEIARVLRFGTACGSVPSLRIGFGSPHLGNSRFTLDLIDGAPNASALLALGQSDQNVGRVPLPFILPSGCGLLVSPDVVLTATTDGSGRATVVFAIPGDPALRGAIVFAQWLQDPGVPFATTEGASIQLF